MTRLRAWILLRRWSILTEGAVAFLVAFVAGGTLMIPGDRDGEATVTAYLEAILAGDTDAAEQYIAEDDTYSGTDRSWLTSDALSGGWRIESVTRRTLSETGIHAVIASGTDRAELNFSLETDDEGVLRITNPYAYLHVDVFYDDEESPYFPLEELELNGHSGTLDPDTEDGYVRVALYPGFYTLAGSIPMLADAEEATFAATPKQDWLTLGTILSAGLAENTAAVDQFNEDLAEWIELCVQNSVPGPEGCPFSAEDDSLSADLHDGSERYSDPRNLTWEIGALPRVRFNSAANSDPFSVEAVEPGWVQLEATADDYYEGDERRVSARCRISLGLNPVLLPSGRFDFSGSRGPGNTCRPE